MYATLLLYCCPATTKPPTIKITITDVLMGIDEHAEMLAHVDERGALVVKLDLEAARDRS